MSNKPSLYVVERKEVVILVILFVLVTVLAFTLGVKYGESLGRKAFLQDQGIQHKMQEDLAGTGGSGTLGGAIPKAEHGDAPVEATPAKPDAAKLENPEAASGAHPAPGSPEEAAAATEKKADAGKPEDAAKAIVQTGPKERPKEVIDTNSDQHLLDALHEAGIQPPKAGAGKTDAKTTKLPTETKQAKTPRVGAFTIQVGSYPTHGDAEQQLKRLKDDHLDAMMLAPVSERNGEWFRVTIGSFGTKNEAERLAKQLQTKGQIKSYFVRKIN